MFNIDIFINIIILNILSVKEICRLSRVNKEFYNLVHNKTVIRYINNLLEFNNNKYKISHYNLLYKVDSYIYPKPINELVVKSWKPLL